MAQLSSAREIASGVRAGRLPGSGGGQGQRVCRRVAGAERLARNVPEPAPRDVPICDGCALPLPVPLAGAPGAEPTLLQLAAQIEALSQGHG